MSASIAVYCHETEEYWPTQSDAAKTFGVGLTTMTRHLRFGKHQNIFGGLTLVIVPEQFCKKCRILLTSENQYKNKERKWCICRKCQLQDKRNNNYKRKYNMTVLDYEDMLRKHRGVCSICGKPERQINQYGLKPLCVDHSHNSGNVRGLLCARCNHQLGWFEKHKNRVLEYIEKF